MEVRIDELERQMRAVADELRNGSSAMCELGDLIDGWADIVGRVDDEATVWKAIRLAKAFKPK